MKTVKTFSTIEAAKLAGLGRQTLVRWLEKGRIRPTIALPASDGRTFWRWTAKDIERARKLKGTFKPGTPAKGKKSAK